ncbi:MarR family winged helix-turn-helix transcriptional regulator [Campylobacter geochelonis]|uniref:MarR family winged helix-turn-helix transcriptional regulator n=1 Tax=Campylobacter geochelonis TaxID=1780362 RepID=UPI000770A1E0|nr:MarR family transcriptional regulator [Campylobacter geochelonis]CZE46333.1 Organic hydroperoxide resistance transcriptional regulator [Campylobacter geochelonis]
MKNRAIIAYCARIREKANKLIINSLKASGYNDIAPSHGDILNLLFSGQSYPMAKVAQKIYRSKSTVTTLVEKLEANGYISRFKSEDDARVVMIKITQKGLELKPIFAKINDELSRVTQNEFSQTELDFLETLLKKMTLNLKELQ